MFSARQEHWSDSSSHFEGWLCDPIILALLRGCTSESTNPRPHFRALQYRFVPVYYFLPCCFYLFKLKIYISTIHITLLSPSLRRTSAPIQFAIVLGVLGTQETLCYLCTYSIITSITDNFKLQKLLSIIHILLVSPSLH